MRKNISLVLSVIAFIAVLTFLLDYKIRPDIKTLDDISEASDTIQHQAPDFQFQDLQGRSSALSEFKGKIVILHFWATWCPPCLIEFPKLVKAVQSDQDLILLAVSSDDQQSAVQKFSRQHDLSQSPDTRIYMIWDQDRKITHDLFQTFAYPETILIDGTGQMIRKIPGDADWTSPDMKSYLKSLTGTLADTRGKP